MDVRPPKRFRDPAVLPWKDPVLVVCPRCGARALVRTTCGGRSRLVCAHCALVRVQTGLHVRVEGRPVVLRLDHGSWLNPQTGKYQRRAYEEPEGEDSRFVVPLWLRAECCGGHLLWANNEPHLDYLESYVGATLRERPEGPARLSWYLPAWLMHAKNRDEVLRTVSRLRASLSDG